VASGQPGQPHPELEPPVTSSGVVYG